MINWRLTLALAGSLLLFGCSTAPQQETPPQKETVPPTPESQDFVAGDVRLSPSQFADLPATRDEGTGSQGVSGLMHDYAASFALARGMPQCAGNAAGACPCVFRGQF